MCGDQDGEARAAARAMGITRRALLTAVGAGTGALLLPGALPAAAGSATFTGQAAVLAALHVHGPNDEQTASVDLQLHRAAAAGYGLVVPTPHNFRALAQGYLTSLIGARMEATTSGSCRQQSGTNTSGALRLLVESAGGAPASLLMSVERTPQAQNALRTSIAGTTLLVTFGVCQVDPGSLLEVVVTLSDHPDGSRGLRYRFGGMQAGRKLDVSGLIGLVTSPLPAPGSRVRLDPVADIAALWPHQVPTDNGLVMLAFCVTSPRRGVVVDANIRSVTIDRTESDQAHIVQRMQEAVDAVLVELPGLTVQPSVEISALNRAWPHLNLFGVPQRIPSNAGVSTAEVATWCRALVADVKAAGGVVSLNHPYGVSGTDTAPSPRTVQAAERRALAAQLLQNDAYGCDVLEVGYAVRGGHDLVSHLALWDVLSRHGRYYTGTGVNDDHLGGDWTVLGNGFGSGLFLDGAGSVTLTAVSQALRAGRSFFVHPTFWPGAGLDLLVDGFLPMGGVDISTASSRTLEVAASNLPSTASVVVRQGLMDYQGSDPVLRTVRTWPAMAFGGLGTGTLAVALDTTHSSSVRVEVRLGTTTVGCSNPVYLQRTAGPVPAPAVRTYR